MTATETNGVAEFDFAYLEISKATARFDMPWVTHDAYLVVRTATSDNEKYNEGSIRMSSKRMTRQAATGTITSADAEQDRQEDRVLYPKYVIVGWGGIEDKKGDAVPYSPQNCKAFIAILPAWIFDRLRLFCMKPERFLDDGDLAESMDPNPVAVAGN